MKTLCVALLFSLVACNRMEHQQDKARVSFMAPPSIENVSYAADASPEFKMNESIHESDYADDRIMKSAQLRFQVDSVGKSTRDIEAVAAKCNGFVADQSMSTAANEINNAITLRVPSSSFEKFIEDICKEAVFINYKKISSQNVTEEYQDIQVRLKTKREVRDRYTDILKTKAKTVEDILKAEEHIRVLQEEIESREGRLHFLQTRTAMSEVTVQIYQKVTFTESPALVERTFSAEVKDALRTGWSIIMKTMLFVISCWPVLLVCFLIFVAWRRFKSRRDTEGVLETGVE